MTKLLNITSGKLLLATGAAITSIIIAYSASTAVDKRLNVSTRKSWNWQRNAGLLAEKVAVHIADATSASVALTSTIAGYVETGEATASGIIAMIEAVPSSYDNLFGS